MQTCPGFFLKSLLESPGNLFSYICRHPGSAGQAVLRTVGPPKPDEIKLKSFNLYTDINTYLINLLSV